MNPTSSARLLGGGSRRCSGSRCPSCSRVIERRSQVIRVPGHMIEHPYLLITPGLACLPAAISLARFIFDNFNQFIAWRSNVWCQPATPNPSIERTFSSRLRRLWNAADVKRCRRLGHLYPDRYAPDCCKVERFAVSVQEKYGVDVIGSWREDITLGEL